jgi:hypothetical protein
MSYFSDFRSAIRAKIGTAWPDVLPGAGGGRIWDEEHLEGVEWAALTPPYAVTLITDAVIEQPSRMAAETFSVILDIYRVQALSGPSDPLWEKLLLLQAALWPNSLPAGSGAVVDVMRMSTNSRLPPNTTFLSKGTPFRAGLIRVQALVAYYRPGV